MELRLIINLFKNNLDYQNLKFLEIILQLIIEVNLLIN